MKDSIALNVSDVITRNLFHSTMNILTNEKDAMHLTITTIAAINIKFLIKNYIQLTSPRRYNKLFIYKLRCSSKNTRQFGLYILSNNQLNKVYTFYNSQNLHNNHRSHKADQDEWTLKQLIISKFTVNGKMKILTKSIVNHSGSQLNEYTKFSR